jgi:pimeloyl-ACP methyl ester carboxylesterase
MYYTPTVTAIPKSWRPKSPAVVTVGFAKFANFVAFGLGTAPDFDPPEAILTRFETAARSTSHRASSSLAAVLAAVQQPIGLPCISERSPAPSWKTKPSWYLLAEEDRMINPKTPRFMAERMKANIRSKAADHAPLLTAPDLVVNIISEAVRSRVS